MMSDEKHVAPWVIEYLIDGRKNVRGEPFQSTELAVDEADCRHILETKIANWHSYRGKKIQFVKAYRTSIYD